MKTARPDDDVFDDFSTAVRRLSRELRTAAAGLGDEAARYLVDTYYDMQHDRIRAAAQIRQAAAGEPPNPVLGWLAGSFETLEEGIRSALDQYTRAHRMGSWMRGVYGIGPVLSAGLLAHIDIARAPTVGHIWQYAGLAADGQKPWTKGEKRPFNLRLKTLCWKVGQSFMKFSNRPECYYGGLYREQKAKYVAINTAGGYRERALGLALKVGKATEAYKHYSAGVLSPGHIDAMARRWAVKLFLAHLHGEWHERQFGKPAPLPYPIAILGHAHQRPPQAAAEQAIPTESTKNGERATERESTKGTRSGPTDARAPMPMSEPSRRRAPPTLSEPSRPRAPKVVSEPSRRRAPKSVSEPMGTRAPTG
jgi:hypothetical protein